MLIESPKRKIVRPIPNKYEFNGKLIRISDWLVNKGSTHI